MQTLTLNGLIINSCPSGILNIGRDSLNTGYLYYLNGYISNARIVKGTAVYTGAFTVPSAPLSATQAAGTNIAAVTGTATSLLTCQSNRFVDNSTNAYAITRVGDTKVQRFSPFSITAAYSTSTTGGSAYFDGTGDYLTVANNTAFDIGSGDFTIEGWVYFSGAPTAFTLATRGVYVSVYSFYAGNLGATPSTLQWEAGTGAWAATAYTSSANALVGGQWNHVAYVRSGTSFYMYANGVRVFSQVIATISTNVTAPLWIGSYFNQGVGNIGNMTDVRFVKGTALYTGATYTIPTAPLTAITNTSLLLNYTNTGIVDYSTINNPETVGDTRKVLTQTPYAGSYYSNYFDGYGDYMDPVSSSVSLSANWTIELWFNTAATGVSILDCRPDATNGFYLSISTQSSTQIGTYYNAITYVITVGTYLGAWNHVAMVKNSGTLTIYFNGVSVYSVADSNTWLIGANRPRLAANGGFFAAAPAYYTGYISNLRIVNGTAVYTTAFTPSTTPLTAITNTRLLTCQSNRFVDNSSNAFAITIVGNTSVQSFNPFQRNSGSSMSFDGTGDYLTVPANTANVTGTGAFTIEFWVYFNNFTNAPGIVDYRPSTTNGLYPLIYVSAAGVLTYYISTTDVITGSTLTAAAWYHVALSRSGSSTKMFINGSQTGSTYTDTNNYVTTGRFIIGGSGYSLGGGILNGYMTDLRITRGYARYTTTFTPPTSSLIV